MTQEISLVDDICHLHVVRTSSAHRPHIVRMGWQQLCMKPTGFFVNEIIPNLQKEYRTEPPERK